VVAISWDEAYRIILSRYPVVGIFDDVVDAGDLEAIFELEARTNERIRDELGAIALVRPADRVVGPGTTPVMAAFTHTHPSRFTDGTFGAYYAARERDSAISETVYHVARLYRQTKEASADIDMRAYVARIAGSFDDLRATPLTDPRLDPDSYAASQPYARGLSDTNSVDGIAYPSVRDPRHRDCVACFRPRLIAACRTHSYLTYRWDGLQQRITAVTEREFLSGFGPVPD
jgi:hypothetical protein